MILVNFKIYKQAFGEGAIELARICGEVAKQTGVEIIPIVSALVAYRIKKEVGGKVFLQNVDEEMDGARTGKISMAEAVALGIDGAIINHAECRKKPGTIRRIVKNRPEGFCLVTCLQTLGQAEKWGKKIKSDYIAYEPKELIGSKDKSVATEKSGSIEKMVKLVGKNRLIVGAGIRSKNDVEISTKMGAVGILVASGVVTDKDPKRQLVELAEGIRV
jgi:triosephosphate isomerase